MDERIAVIGDASLCFGFRIIGLERTFIVEKGREFESTIEKIISEQEYGIVVVNQLYLQDIDWRLKKKLDNLAHPVVIPVPDSSGAKETGEDLNALIKRALGFDISKKK
ncbi:V-type ATP synthase subunit F [Candidatus Micrarchaeota archaeon]|nr:V-type ATP synthase subunit F [Candidatus Micrarchaeota archaeon]